MKEGKKIDKHAGKNNQSFFSTKKNANSVFFQPKLSVGPVDDPFEREADAVAEQVMQMSDNQSVQAGISPFMFNENAAIVQKKRSCNGK